MEMTIALVILAVIVWVGISIHGLRHDEPKKDEPEDWGT